MSFTLPIDFTDPNQFLGYFEQLATEHHYIQHSKDKPRFSGFDPWQYEEQAPLRLHLPAVLVMHEEGSVIDKKSDNLIDNIDASFVILDHVKVNDFKGINNSLSLAKAIGRDFIIRMRNDKADGKIQGLLLDDVEYQKAGPVYDNHYGYQFSFTIQAPWSLLERNVWQQ